MGGSTIEMAGKVFGRWTVIGRAPSGATGKALWRCRCACGSEGIVPGTALRFGSSLSCGCLRTETTINRSTTHGHASRAATAPTYHTWLGMVARCTNPKHKDYPRYAERGITVCDRWRDSFENFLADMGERPRGATLDRRDNNAGYSKDNCRWTTMKSQTRNKSNNVFIDWNGRSMIVGDWAAEMGINTSTLQERLAKWPLERAMTEAPKELPPSVSLTVDGVTRSVAEWSTMSGVPKSRIYRRLKAGWPQAHVLSRDDGRLA